MESSIGSPFFPGIEITYVVWDPSLNDAKPFRINRGIVAGDITRHMAIPWQADFLACADDWWPTARPDDVIPDDNGSINLRTHKPWARKSDDSEINHYLDMVNVWSTSGFIKPRNISDETFFIEMERSMKGPNIHKK